MINSDDDGDDNDDDDDDDRAHTEKCRKLHLYKSRKFQFNILSIQMFISYCK